MPDRYAPRVTYFCAWSTFVEAVSMLIGSVYAAHRRKEPLFTEEAFACSMSGSIPADLILVLLASAYDRIKNRSLSDIEQPLLGEATSCLSLPLSCMLDLCLKPYDTLKSLSAYTMFFLLKMAVDTFIGHYVAGYFHWKDDLTPEREFMNGIAGLIIGTGMVSGVLLALYGYNNFSRSWCSSWAPTSPWGSQSESPPAAAQHKYTYTTPQAKAATRVTPNTVESTEGPGPSSPAVTV